MKEGNQEETVMRMERMKAAGLGIAALAAAGLGLAASGSPVAAQAQDQAAQAEAAGDRLGETISRAIKAEGPFFTDAERAVIERKCGYAPGEWDGFDANMSDGRFVCTNGKRVDDAEMRALMDVAGPRIGRRVSAAMARPEVEAAIAAVAEAATREALASVDEAAIAREVEAAVREAMAETRRSARRGR
jgi:hypothetical protein